MTQKEKKDYADAILKLFEASIDNPTAGPRLLSNYRESILALTPKQKEEIAEYLFDRSAQLFLQYHSSRGLHHISGVTHYDELIKKSEEFFEVFKYFNRELKDGGKKAPIQKGKIVGRFVVFEGGKK